MWFSRYLRRCTQNFDATRLLGEGAFGTVFRGEDAKRDSRFAVKRLNGLVHFGSSQARAAAERGIQREIEVLRQIRHPNIITLLGFACDGADQCVVFELGAGGSSRTWEIMISWLVAPWKAGRPQIMA